MTAYEPDEFDRLAAKRKVVGVHMRPVPFWKRIMPAVVTVVVAAGLGVGSVFAVNYWNNSAVENSAVLPSTSAKPETETEQKSATGSEQGADQKDKDGAATNSGDQSKPADGSAATANNDGSAASSNNDNSANPAPAPSYSKDIAISVLNGTNVQGWAGQKAKSLQALGFTKIAAGNYKSANPKNSAVFYAKADDEAAAKDIAKALGIADSAVEKNPAATGGKAVVVVLRGDLKN